MNHRFMAPLLAATLLIAPSLTGCESSATSLPTQKVADQTNILGATGTVHRATATSSPTVTAQALITVPATANTNQYTGIAVWSFFVGTLRGMPYDVWTGTTSGGAVVYEIDATTSTTYKTVSVLSNAGTSLVATNGTTVAGNNHMNIDSIYLAALVRDLTSFAGGQQACCGGKPITGPISNITMRRAAAANPTASKQVFDMATNLGTNLWQCTSGFSKCVTGLVSAGNYLVSIGAITQSEEWWIFTVPPVYPMEVALMDYNDAMANAPVAAFSEEMTVYANGQEPTWSSGTYELDFVSTPAVPEPEYSEPIGSEPGQSAGEGCVVNIQTEAEQCVIKI